MNVIVTGATGFLGHHIVNQLLERGHKVTAVARDVEKAKQMPWIDRVTFIACDLHHDFDHLLAAKPCADVLIHLAWPGLPNYKGDFNITENLPADIKFLLAAVGSGISQVIVAGTCLEYGKQEGALREDGETLPTTPYGIAKDSLRKALQQLQKKQPFILQWVRLFYMFGEGQNPKSLLAQLDRAIVEKQPVFKMSNGDQLRDYLPVTEIAANFVRLAEHPECNGIINCCSGKPISVLELVQQHCRERGANIQLERGVYPRPDYEPMAFWGVPEKLASLPGD